MTPTSDFLHQANKVIRQVLDELAPQLLKAQGAIEHKLKSDKTVVTEMDLIVEERLRQALAKFDKGIGFGGEETGVDFDQQTFWLADPIDGTEPFIRGMPFATNMIALIHDGEPVMSVINNFAVSEYYLAIKGEGATCNGHAIRVSDRQPDRAWLAYGVAAERQDAHGLYDELHTIVTALRRFCGAGYDYSQVARGSIEGRLAYHGHGHEWDFAPGALLVQEAGGRVANIGSDTYDYRNFDFIAANPVIFDDLMAFMNKFAAKKP